MASPQVSPGLQVIESAVDNVIPSTTTGNGAFVGNFTWGPVGAVTIVADENQLVSQFGKPNDNNYLDFFSAANFLSYTNALYLIRTVGTGSVNAVTNLGVADPYAGTVAGGILIKNQDDYDHNFADGSITTHGQFAAKYAGSLGNSVAWSMADASSYSKNLVGTVTTSVESNIVVGVGTHFASVLEVGGVLKDDTGKVIGSVKTSSKDRIDKIFLDKFLYSRLTETATPHIAIFLNDVQRKKTRKENNYRINSTFLPGHFKGYTLKLNPLEGIYYCDIRPDMKTDVFMKSHIRTIDCFFFDDLMKLIE